MFTFVSYRPYVLRIALCIPQYVSYWLFSYRPSPSIKLKCGINFLNKKSFLLETSQPSCRYAYGYYLNVTNQNMNKTLKG